MSTRQRRDCHEALLDADTFEDLSGMWQLGHKDGTEILKTYGHGAHGVLDRLQRGTALKSATPLPLTRAQEAL